VMPAVILVVVLVATVETMADLQTGDSPDALQVEIVGHQWWWEVNYPDAGVTTANEIHIPVGQPVEFTLTSADVIHSFWVPQLGGKLDLLPEDENVLVLEADAARVYRSQCAEFCGLQHANMGFVVVAEPPDEFQAWLDAQSQAPSEPAAGEAEQGREVFLGSNCVECHAIRGLSTPTKPGPDLTHFAGRSNISAALLPNTPEQLREWIADPQHFKEGTSMPAADLSDDDLSALVTYLQGLE
ncbi:MAG: cytochrome c oxidase subunit II, partial [Actinobacteria bacterium]|nr:cytochrome c oxidase subunit II [Actinomycetota bacterium]